MARTKGDPYGVAATINASDTQGPGRRIDRIYTSSLLLPALVDLEVVTMRELSDHHTVVAD